MPTYGKDNFKESNVNYLNKDFSALKQSLMNYAKSYFPDTYRDFNETSPGMMLLEMNAYVGDTLSFYIDQQYREMLLPLAEERRNIITMAKMFGYKVKPIVPSYVDLTFTSEVNASSGDSSKVDYSNAGTWNPGIEIVSSTDSNTIFTTLEHIDFRISESIDTETIGTTADSGLAESYTLSRTVKAVSATQKTLTFQIGIPEKFRTITIPDTNVIDIISCIDSNNNNWYEVDYLAQDKVVIPTHYTDDINRDSAYSSELGGLNSSNAVPYSLTYITTPKRFTRETNLDNTTSLVFGNGVLKDGQIVDENFIDLEQIGIVIPGQTNDLNNFIDPTLGDEYSTLGETPNQTTLTITYRVGGGIESNVPSGDITTTPSITAQSGLTTATLTSVTNNNPARGGKDEEDTLEIREKTKAFFSTQNRCVTKEDYEARVMNIPAKYGNIAKVYVTKADISGLSPNIVTDITNRIQAVKNVMLPMKNRLNDILDQANNPDIDLESLKAVITYYLASEEDGGMPEPSPGGATYLRDVGFENAQEALALLYPFYQEPELIQIKPIDIFILAYNNKKQLVGNPNASYLTSSDNLPATLVGNIKNYLDNFIMMTDTATINDGYIVNFGVIFDVIAEKYANKQKVKLDCIQKIKDYFRIEKMQFNQPIFKSNLEFELMGVEGVRSIGHVTITQKDDYHESNESANSLTESTYTYSYATGGDTFEDSSVGNGEGTSGYGYKYDFSIALSDDGTIILPPNTGTPAVFELKNPNQNIQGRVR